MYSGQVAFTAINSQNVASEEDQNGCPGDETKSLQDRERQSASPGIITAEPCSPKSIYQVANQVCFAPPGDIGTNNFFPQVGLTRLCDIAFKDIQSQLDENNILEELFSPFTAESVISKLTAANRANEIPHDSHERIKEMEYELFQSKLKHLVEGAPLYDIIESSASGEHPHRAAVMELILERSVQRCRKGTLSEVKDIPQPDSTRSQPKKISGAPNILTQPMQPPVPAQQLQSMPSSNSTIASAPMMINTPPSSSTHSQPPVKVKGTKRDEPPANTKANQSSGHKMELACGRCGGEPLGFKCGTCSNYIMQCSGCRSFRVTGINGCANCSGTTCRQNQRTNS